MNPHPEQAYFRQQTGGYFVTCEPCKGRGFDEEFYPCQPCDGYGKIWINEPHDKQRLRVAVFCLLMFVVFLLVILANSCGGPRLPQYQTDDGGFSTPAPVLWEVKG